MKRDIRLVPVLLICLLANAGPACAGDTDISARERPHARVITAAAEPDYPPFSMVNENGDPAGFAVELFHAAARAAGLTVRMRVGIWSRIMTDLVEGRLDALPLVGRTPEREPLFDFTMPYLSLHGAVFVRRGTRDIHSLDDLKKMEIAVMKDDNAEELLRRYAISERIVTTHTFEEAFRQLAEGRHDAVVTQRIMGLNLLRSMGIDSIQVLDLQLPRFRQDFCFAVRKGDQALLDRLNEGLSIVIANDTYEDIRSNWFGPRHESRDQMKRLVRTVIIIAVLIFIMAGGITILLLRREVRRRTGELRYLKNQLELTVAERTEELRQKVTKLDRSKQAMLYMVEDLNFTTKALKEERRKLQDSNNELEAFSYSVSHDLRAPLRAIDGYSRFLEEDYADRMDSEGQRFIETIRASANQMDRLISDLLNLSRTSRKEMSLMAVDMAALIRSMYNEVADDKEKRSFDFTVASMPRVHCDPNLIKQVWRNLIENALKYSSKSEKKEIFIDAVPKKKEIVFSIRDSGQGFDERYKDKLFGVFQRLHGDEDFPGTGVGLAIVKRIVHRHGGRVWASGKVNEGATFFFTLPRDTTDFESKREVTNESNE